MKRSPWPRVIVRRRRQLDLSQEEAADRAGVTPGTWLRWEKDGFSPNVKQQKSIAAGLECTVEELGTWVARETVGPGEDGNGGLPEDLAALVTILQDASVPRTLDDRGTESALRAARGLVQAIERFEELSRRDPFSESLLGSSPGSGPESLMELSQYFVGRCQVIASSILHVTAEFQAAWPRFEAEAPDEQQENVLCLRGEMKDLMNRCLSVSAKLGEVRSASVPAHIAAMAEEDPDLPSSY